MAIMIMTSTEHPDKMNRINNDLYHYRGNDHQTTRRGVGASALPAYLGDSDSDGGEDDSSNCSFIFSVSSNNSRKLGAQAAEGRRAAQGGLRRRRTNVTADYDEHEDDLVSRKTVMLTAITTDREESMNMSVTTRSSASAVATTAGGKSSACIALLSSSSTSSAATSSPGKTRKWKCTQEFKYTDDAMEGPVDHQDQNDGSMLLTSISKSLSKDVERTTDIDSGNESVTTSNRIRHPGRVVVDDDVQSSSSIDIVGHSSASIYYDDYHKTDNGMNWFSISLAVFDYVVAVVVGYWIFVTFFNPTLSASSTPPPL